MEVGVLRLCLRPRREGACDIVAEHNHEVIAFGEDHQARWRPDPANDVRNRVRVTGERPNAGLQLRDDRPYERSGRREPSAYRLRGPGCLRLKIAERDTAHGTREECASIHSLLLIAESDTPPHRHRGSLPNLESTCRWHLPSVRPVVRSSSLIAFR